MASSKLPASKVLEMIECEIEGLPLKETGYRADVSETACFNFRQRLYAMASIQLENIQLHGQTEVDSTYAKINLSGTKPENMPRLSKKRGRKDPVIGEHDAESPCIPAYTRNSLCVRYPPLRASPHSEGSPNRQVRGAPL